VRWTAEQLQNHPKRDELLGIKPYQKATDQQLIDSYAQTGSVWKTAAQFGMCGQSVWERLCKLGKIESDFYTPEQEKLIEDFYCSGFKKGELEIFCKRNGFLKPNVSRWARHQGLTNCHRKLSVETVDKMGARIRKWYDTNEHPKGFLGKKHTSQAREKMATALAKFNSEITAPERRLIALKMLKTKASKGILIMPRKGSWKQGWSEIGGKRCFFRSTWELRFAGYLEMLKKGGIIAEWEYEPQTFWFEGICRGTTNYTPDFKITLPGGGIEFWEVKGWMDARSRTKLRRMKKYHPDVVIKVFDQNWFRTNKNLC
jgi:hypothetical protein